MNDCGGRCVPRVKRTKHNLPGPKPERPKGRVSQAHKAGIRGLFSLVNTETAMPRKQLIAGCILGALATVAVGLGYGYQQPAELPTAYHDFAAVPRDSAEFDKQWHNLGTAIWRETIKHPKQQLFIACQLKTQGPRAD